VRRQPAWAALAVLALACALRLVSLRAWSFDGDELYSVHDVHRILAGEVWSEGVRSHPLGYLGMALCAALFGEGEGVMRAFAAATGTGAVAALLFLRRDALPRSVALSAGLAAALSPWLIFHAQEARFYAPLLLCATLATLWALPGPGRRPVAATLAALAALLCHPSALLLAPCLLLPTLASATRRARWTLVGAAGVAVALMALLVGDAVVDVVQAAITRRALSHYDALHLVQGFGYNLGPGLGALALLGAVSAWRARTEGERQLLLAGWAPPLLLLVAALCGVSTHQRYAMAAVPALLLLAGKGLVASAGCLARGTRLPAWRSGLLLLALAPSLPALADYHRSGDRSDMRAAAAWIAGHAGPADNIVADEHWLLDLYLSRAGASADRRLTEETLRNEQRKKLLQSESDCWVVLKCSRMQGAYGEDLLSWVDRFFIERTRIGNDPPPLVRHDNRLVILQRRARAKTPVLTPPENGTRPSPPRKMHLQGPGTAEAPR